MVYIVLCNGIVDEVFDSWLGADAHCKNLQKKWNITQIIEREVKYI